MAIPTINIACPTRKERGKEQYVYFDPKRESFLEQRCSLCSQPINVYLYTDNPAEQIIVAIATCKESHHRKPWRITEADIDATGQKLSAPAKRPERPEKPITEPKRSQIMRAREHVFAVAPQIQEELARRNSADPLGPQLIYILAINKACPPQTWEQFHRDWSYLCGYAPEQEQRAGHKIDLDLLEGYREFKFNLPRRVAVLHTGELVAIEKTAHELGTRFRLERVQCDRYFSQTPTTFDKLTDTPLESLPLTLTFSLSPIWQKF